MPKSIKVLVIESKRYRTIIRNVLTRDPRLRTRSFEIHEARDGMDGLQQFKELHPDIIILEALLPKMSGFEVIRTVRSDVSGEKTSILVTTNLAPDQGSLSILVRHFNVTIQHKPFTPWDLAKTLQQLATTHKELSASSRRKKRPSARNTSPGPDGPIKKAPSQVEMASPDREQLVVKDLPHAGSGRSKAERSAKYSTTDSMEIQRFMRGDLSQTTLPALLLDALERKISGKLTLSQDTIRKVIYLQSGYPIFVQSNLRKENLGQMMIRKGRLSPADHSKAMDFSKKKKIPFGEALVQLDLVSREEVNEQILANVRLKLEASLLWTRGAWLFVQDLNVGKKVPHCSIDPISLIFGGLKRRANIEDALSSLTGKEEYQFEISSVLDKYKEQYAAAFDDKLIKKIEPEMTMGQILMATGSYPQEVVFQMYILLRTGLARLIKPKELEAPDESLSGFTISNMGDDEAVLVDNRGYASFDSIEEDNEVQHVEAPPGIFSSPDTGEIQMRCRRETAEAEFALHAISDDDVDQAIKAVYQAANKVKPIQRADIFDPDSSDREIDPPLPDEPPVVETPVFPVGEDAAQGSSFEDVFDGLTPEEEPAPPGATTQDDLAAAIDEELRTVAREVEQTPTLEDTVLRRGEGQEEPHVADEPDPPDPPADVLASEQAVPLEDQEEEQPLKGSREEKAARRMIRFTYNNLQQKNHYDLLGLDPWCISAAIDEAYEDLNIKFAHSCFAGMDISDLSKELQAIQQSIMESYRVLSDGAARNDYDRSLGFLSQDGASTS